MFTEEEVNKMISNVQATLRVEGLEMSDLSKELGKMFLQGEITSEEAIKIIAEYIKSRNKEA